jgi:hypothetical protein
MRVGDRVKFIEKSPHFPMGWPCDREGVLIEEPYQGVFYARLDGYPLSKVATLPHMVVLW